MSSDSWQDRLAALRSAMGPDQACTEPEVAPASEAVPAQSAPLEIVLERKGRAGKCATIIAGFSIPDTGVAELAAALKRSLGTGGSARGGEILIQGDRRADVRRILKEKGFKVKGG